jgi:hypothetical protein
MSNELIGAVVTILLAIAGVAVIATLVSKNANTSGVITAGSRGFSTGLGAALSPVTGSGPMSFQFSGGGAL